MVTAPRIPSNVTNMNGAFMYCMSLTEAPIIPPKTVYLANAFQNCKKLTEAPEIPDSVKYIDSIFANCTKLTTVTRIPASVSGTIGYAFHNCTSLTGTITIDVPDSILSTINFHYAAFTGVDFEAQNLTLNGSASNKVIDKLGSYGTNYCTTCNGKCQHNH